MFPTLKFDLNIEMHMNRVLLIGFLILSGVAESRIYKAIGTNWDILKRLEVVDKSQIRSYVKPQEFLVEGYKFRLKSKRNKKVQLTIQNPLGKTVWQSEKGEPFVAAGQGEGYVSQWRGSFNIQDRRGKAVCPKQAIDSVRVIKEEKSKLRISGYLHGRNCRIPFNLDFTPQDSKKLKFALKIFENQNGSNEFINRLTFYYKSKRDERFYGFGEQFAYSNLKGKVVPILSQEQGHVRGANKFFTFVMNVLSPGSAGAWHTTYTAIPFYMTNTNKGLYLDNKEYLYFDLTKRRSVEVRVWSKTMSGAIIGGDSPLDVIEKFTEHSGRPQMMPDWVHKGAIIGFMGGSEFVEEIDEVLSAENTPISAYWLQDWVGQRKTEFGTRLWWNWDLDIDLYDKWFEFKDEMKSRGIKLLGYINPFLTDVTEQETETQRIDLLREARDNNYVLVDDSGKPIMIDSGGFDAALIDLSNPSAKNWLKNYLLNVSEIYGFDGWMADFGEAVPFNAQPFSGEKGETYHNQYVEDWSKFNRELSDEINKRRGTTTKDDGFVFFVRNATIGSSKYADLYWLGDQMVTWDRHDGLKSSIHGLITGGMSGMAINHSDIGGIIALKRDVGGVPVVNYQRSKELFQRWAELNAFTAVFRTHDGNNPHLVHQFYDSTDALKHFAYFAKVFEALFDYRKTLYQEAHEKGYPIARHMLFHYPNDEEVLDLDYQYMLGADFLIAPIVNKRHTKRDVYLPKGDWVHLWSGQNISSKGDYYDVPAKIGRIPVFYKKDSKYGPNFRAKILELGLPEFGK